MKVMGPVFVAVTCKCFVFTRVYVSSGNRHHCFRWRGTLSSHHIRRHRLPAQVLQITLFGCSDLPVNYCCLEELV